MVKYYILFLSFWYFLEVQYDVLDRLCKIQPFISDRIQNCIQKALHLIYKLQWNFTIHGTSMSAFVLLSPHDSTSKQTRIRAQSQILKRHLNQINMEQQGLQSEDKLCIMNIQVCDLKIHTTFSPCSCFVLKMLAKRQTQSELKPTRAQTKSANCHLWIKEDYNIPLAWSAHKSHFTKNCTFVQKMIQ